MTEPLYLSRARLRRDVPEAALRAMVAPVGDDTVRTATAHHLVWTLFGDARERRRDFLWREADAGVFYLLSARAPKDRHALFDVDPPKLFAPSLRPGDRLRFALRVNATVAKKREGDTRGRPCDIVMDAIHDLNQPARAGARKTILPRLAHAWLGRQGAAHGFVLPELEAVSDDDGTPVDPCSFQVQSYRVLRLPRERQAKPLSLGVLDVAGVLEVREPSLLLAAIGNGFGRGKAFGCGLMLIRRA